MIERDSPHPAGTVGYLSGGTPRYLPFFDAVEATEVPRGTKLRRAISCNPAKGANVLLEHTVGDWLWIQGDDHRWPADLLLRLLDHRADAVVPLVARWGPPFLPVVYKSFDPKAGETQMYSWQELQLLRQTGQRLVPVAAAGSAGLLVRRHVWEAVRETYGEPVFRVGLTGPDELCEDLEFTWKITQLGFDLLCDLTAFEGHLTVGSVEPYALPDGRLAITVDVHGGRLLAYATQPWAPERRP